MTLTIQQKKQLRLKAAQLQPVVLIGNKGLTDAVHKEIEVALVAHELIKIRYHQKERDFRLQTAELICQQHQADLVQSIGHVIVIYRPQQEKG